MLIKDFENFKPYFSANENWGDIEKISWTHVHQLWQIRTYLYLLGMKWPMVIHNSYASSGHANNSMHYKGLATDWHFVTEATFQEQYRLLCAALSVANLSAFCGLGVYPDFDGKKGFFHYDSRGFCIRWIRLDVTYYYGEDKILSYFSSNGR